MSMTRPFVSLKIDHVLWASLGVCAFGLANILIISRAATDHLMTFVRELP